MFPCYHLFIRRNDLNILRRGYRLFQQYIFDQFRKVESEKLLYFRQIQQVIQEAEYTLPFEQLGDPEHVKNEAKNVRSRLSFVRCSTHLGGERYVRQNTHDVIDLFN